MNYYAARELISGEGDHSGIWHYTVANDEYIYAIGYCIHECPGHTTPEEACEHYRLYLLDNARYNGVMSQEKRKCEICEEWTQGVAHIPFSMEKHILCDAHRNREFLDQVMNRVGTSVSSY